MLLMLLMQRIYDTSLHQHLRWSRWVLPFLPPCCLRSNQNKLQWPRPHLSHLSELRSYVISRPLQAQSPKPPRDSTDVWMTQMSAYKASSLNHPQGQYQSECFPHMPEKRYPYRHRHKMTDIYQKSLLLPFLLTQVWVMLPRSWVEAPRGSLNKAIIRNTAKQVSQKPYTKVINVKKNSYYY